ncbi:MAG TPA: HAD family hydrolase [Planctomycetaceae bacterium]|nr:HAD family hydrolase [Planctomycetaceae bacterium]HQZ64030.1 HAD family hydrolase [Planctomycetaceae bacterium]
MSQSLAEYADHLDERRLIWPKVPAPKVITANPYAKPLPGIRAVLWDVYGTLLRVSDGRFTLFPDDEVRLQIALDKTIHEFNMWNHMYRKPGPPWQSMIGLYKSVTERQSMLAAPRGDVTEVNLVETWRAIIERLFEKEYHFDEDLYGDLDEFSEKVAYFFHCCLQATEARAGAVQAMTDIAANEMQQGFLADGQSFTLVQTLRALAIQGPLPPLYELFRPQTLILSHNLGVKKPSRSLFTVAVDQLRSLGIQAQEILHISCRLKTDLVPARAAGMKTALLVAEKSGLEVDTAILKDPSKKPDRLLTDLSQLYNVLFK